MAVGKSLATTPSSSSQPDSLWDNSKVLHDKGDALEQKDAHVMKALGLDVQFLIDVQENIKVQIIKDESRKMYSDIYNVQSLAKDTTKRVEALH